MQKPGMQKLGDTDVTPTPKTVSPEIPLFVHIRLQTCRRKLLLTPEDVMQLAQTCIAAKMRLLRCRTAAIGGTANHLHIVIRFPASLPVSEIVKVACASSSEAVSQILCYAHGRRIAAEAIWERFYGMQTLSPGEVADVAAYVRDQERHHRQRTTRKELEMMITPRHISRPKIHGYLIREIIPNYIPDKDEPPEQISD